MKTIDLEIEMNFTEAVKYLTEGKCIGIRPKGNSGFIVKYKPIWMNNESKDFILCWCRTVKDGKGSEGIRTEQYLDTWNPVVIDTNSLPEDIKNVFVFENITLLVDRIESLTPKA